jgi:hypothetical protein
MNEDDVFTYDNLAEELEDLGDGVSVLRGSGYDDIMGSDSSDDQEDQDYEIPPASYPSNNNSYFGGPSVQEIFPQKPKRFRRGKTAGKTLPLDIVRPLTEAYQAYSEKDYTTATSLLSEIAKMAPRLPDPYNIMALMHEDRGNLTSAAQLYLMAAIHSSTKAVKIWLKVIDLSLIIGGLYCNSRNYHMLTCRFKC